MEKFPITIEGYKNLEAELKNLKSNERPAISKKISEAREHGDLSENAEYHAARERQSFIEGKIIELEDKMARADVIDVSKLSGKKIKFGALVGLIDDETDEKVSYRIVGEYEADISKNLVSVMSPLARALISKEEGDNIEFTTPKGSKAYYIDSVEY